MTRERERGGEGERYTERYNVRERDTTRERGGGEITEREGGRDTTREREGGEIQIQRERYKERGRGGER